VSTVTWPASVGGRLAVRVYERASGLAWGLREAHGSYFTCEFGWRDREEGLALRCSTGSLS
jgi:hypothetical protein